MWLYTARLGAWRRTKSGANTRVTKLACIEVLRPIFSIGLVWVMVSDRVGVFGFDVEVGIEVYSCGITSSGSTHCATLQASHGSK